MWCPSELISNSNLEKSHSSITPVSVVQSFWNFGHSTAMILPCSVQNAKTTGRLRNKWWTNKFSRDLVWSFGRISYITQQRHLSHHLLNPIFQKKIYEGFIFTSHGMLPLVRHDQLIVLRIFLWAQMTHVRENNHNNHWFINSFNKKNSWWSNAIAIQQCD